MSVSPEASDKSRDTGSASLLADVLLMSESMLSKARDGHWEDVTEIERLRSLALSKCFAQSVPESQSEVFSVALAAMLHMNEEVISLLEAAKKDIAIKRSDHNYTKRSLGHYLDVEDQN